MERSTSVSTGMGEQSLTPGEQRILSLMEQGQQRLVRRLDGMDQRLQSLEEGQKRTNAQLQDLTIKVDKEAADSKLRDREFATELDRIIQVDQERARTLHDATLAAIHIELNSFRKTLTERLDQHHLRLKALEQTIEQNYAHTHRNSASIERNSEAIEGLQVDMRKLVELVAGLVQAQPARAASAP